MRKAALKSETRNCRLESNPSTYATRLRVSLCPRPCWESKKSFLKKKVNALVVGPFRSEALLAAMDIIAKHKVPMLGTIAMSPKSEAKLMENPEKYKYIFRTCLNGKYLVGYLIGGMKFPEPGVRFQ